jgi:hypothetical protein
VSVEGKYLRADSTYLFSSASRKSDAARSWEGVKVGWLGEENANRERERERERERVATSSRGVS